ncbi:MAG: glycosyltransferase [Bacteroidota bacterium]
MSSSPKYCVATVTTPDFVPGTLVLLHSFLQNNPWFDGDVILISQGLEQIYTRYFQIFPQLIYEEVDPEIVSRTDRLCEQHEQFAQRRAQFYSLQLLRLRGYDKLLFLDSDMVIVGDLRPVFEREEPFLACADGFYYKGWYRDAKTYEKVLPEEVQLGRELWLDTFNSGFMMVNQSLLTDQAFEEAVGMINDDYFSSVSTNHSDQLIFNVYFRKKFTLLSSKYNYRFGVGQAIREKDGISFEEASVLHFTSKRKPWRSEQVLRAAFRIKHYRRSYDQWLRYWNGVLDELEQLPKPVQ